MTTKMINLDWRETEEQLLVADFTEAVMSYSTRYFGHADILLIMKVHSVSKTYAPT
jgi:hypothetical protein